MKQRKRKCLLPIFHRNENTDLVFPFYMQEERTDKLRNESRYYFEKNGINNRPLIIGVTSTKYNEGAYQTAVALAQSYAKAKASVLLLDMDVYKSPAASFLASEHYKGQFFRQENGLLNSTDGFDFFRITSKEENGDIFEKLTPNYDYVICLLPPVLDYADADEASQVMDGFVLTVRESFTRQQDLMDVLDYAQTIRSKMIGFMYYQTN